MRTRLENPRWNVIDPVLGPAPQILERGSAVTNNSLAANQRPNISLIDRRLSGARRVPYRVHFNRKKTCLAGKSRGQRLHLTQVSHINAELSGAALLAAST